MRKRNILIFTLVSLAVIVATTLSLTRKREPRYQDRALSELIDASDRYFGNRDRAQREAAANGVREIGTNAIPFLLDWIQHEDPVWKSKLRDLTERVTGKDRLSNHQLQLANNAAVHAFATLGLSADAAIADLVILMAKTNRIKVAERAAVALCYSARPNALPPLLAVLTNAANPLRWTVAESIHEMGSNALPALPALINRLEDVDEMVAKSAASSLGEINAQPQLVIPALMAAVRPERPIVSRFAIAALGDYGTNATQAIPLLMQNLTNSDEVARSSATNALQRVAPEHLADTQAK